MHDPATALHTIGLASLGERPSALRSLTAILCTLHDSVLV